MSLITLLPNDPAPGELLAHVADLLSDDVRAFAAYWLPVAVWASDWNVHLERYAIAVSMSGDTLAVTQNRDTVGREAPRQPLARRTVYFVHEPNRGWVQSNEVPSLPTLHVFLPPRIPDGGFNGEVLFERSETSYRHLSFGPFRGDEKPRDHFPWSEDGGYEWMDIYTGFDPGFDFRGPPPFLRLQSA